MKITFLSIIFLICTQFAINAQEQYIILSGGITNPLSDFADNNFENAEAGYATSGYNFGFELAHFFNPWFGLGGSFKFNSAGFDSQKFNTALDEKYGNNLDTIYLSSGDYNLHNFLAGPYGKVNIGNHLSIFGKAFIGVLSTFRPDQTLAYKEFGQDEQYVVAPGTLAGGFAWNFGTGIIIKVSDRFGIIAKADYIAANTKYEVYDYVTIEVVSKTQAIRYVNYNIGIALSM